MRTGWHQIAFERDVPTGGLTPAEIGPVPLVLARTASSLRAFDARCPHRGAHLGWGGRLDGDSIVCGFHGHRVGLGVNACSGYRIREHRTLVVGGLVVVHLAPADEHGLPAVLAELDRTHYFVPGFTLRVRVAAELVIENGFDQAHFRTVHGVLNDPRLTVRRGVHGELVAEGMFDLPPSPWQRGATPADWVRVPYVARAFSPGLVVSDMGGPHPYTVITAATPTHDGEAMVHLSLAVPAGPGGTAPPADRCRYLLDRARAGLEKDRVIWEHLVPGNGTDEGEDDDSSARAFQEFCGRFRVPERV